MAKIEKGIDPHQPQECLRSICNVSFPVGSDVSTPASGLLLPQSVAHSLEIHSGKLLSLKSHRSPVGSYATSQPLR